MELPLRYGLNPHQGAARVHLPRVQAPLRVQNGAPSYINVLDALTGWELVRELKAATGKTAAASLKHVSPAGAAVAGEVPAAFVRAQMLRAAPTGPAAQAYVRARGADRMSAFGDAVAISDPVDLELAKVLKTEVSDLIIAPGFEPGALEVLCSKKRGTYLVMEIDPTFEPPRLERREVFGLTLEQERNAAEISPAVFRERAPGPVPDSVAESLVVATIALKYTQSNSVCVAHDGQVIGMGAGQQSRIHCTRLACEKAEKWMLQTHPRVLALRFTAGIGRTERTNAIDQYLSWDQLSDSERKVLRTFLEIEPEPITAAERQAWFGRFDGLVLSSDASIPFRDNVDRAARSGVRYIAHTGRPARGADVQRAADEHGVMLLETGLRCFLH
jgi:phosphoribosylaminoimidazolecarboxamide formyltransferase / IMP cyclohydrolase